MSGSKASSLLELTVKQQQTSINLCVLFDQLSISVREGSNLKQIISNTNGKFVPGEFSVIMGPSGTGKTTLLKALCCNTYGLEIQGNIIYADYNIIKNSYLYPDFKIDSKVLQHYIQLVYQEDAFYEYMTPREVLKFTAKLRNYSASSIDKVLQQIEIQHVADNYIGGITIKGISGGERKRLSIAIALLSNPRILLLDEPTTGLDSETAEIILKLLKKEAVQYNRTIIATIHQPSSEMYGIFDNIMLLAQGHAAYIGSTKYAIEYFKSGGYQCEDDSNPTEFFLDTLCQMDQNQVLELKEAGEEYMQTTKEQQWKNFLVKSHISNESFISLQDYIKVKHKVNQQPI